MSLHLLLAHFHCAKLKLYVHWTIPHFPFTQVLATTIVLFLRIWLSAAAAAASLQSCPLCATPETSAHQVPLSLGFSRQEHWSGLPFPSPLHESEKWKWSLSVVSDPERPHGLQPTRLLRPWDFPGESTGVGCHCLLHWLFKIPHILCCLVAKFCLTLETLWTVTLQAPLSMGFSGQEYWSGLDL